MGKLANCRWPWFKNALIKWFIQHYRVDMSIAEITDIAKYPHFNAFFTRTVLPSARPIVQGENTVACPVDGFVSQMGSIGEQQILQAKGFDYDLIKLLGGDEQRALPFHNGSFATLYLS
ncbi:MAG: phosphatidylserine decarboxylase, partial [Bacteroidetes bacterium]|nr:phosphatidylserine decarboxylase [Bacteroidota bacterium]